MADPAHSVSDVTLLRGDRFLVLERDNGQGTEATWKRAFLTELPRRSGTELPQRQVVDLLNLRDPKGISLRDAQPGDLGIGDPFSFSYQTVEAVLPVGRDRLAVVNDTNISGSKGRNPARDDDSDFIKVRVPGLSR
jgi:glycerophosphoryl diester phosphodiesterase